MKTRKNILALLDKAEPESEDDLLMTLGCCCQHDIFINYRLSKKVGLKFNFQQFKKWFDDATTSFSPIVFDTEDVIGIVKEVDIHSLTLCISLKDGTLFVEPITLPLSDYHEASINNKAALQNALSKSGLEWNNRTKEIIPRSIPSINKYVRLSVLDEVVGFGVLREITSSGDLVMYCVKMNNEAARYSLEEIVGKSDDFQIQPMTHYEIKDFARALKIQGKIWNAYLNRIEPIKSRVKVNGRYFYINDCFRVVDKIERASIQDTQRWWIGNYFLKKRDANTALKNIQSQLTKLSIPQNNDNKYFFLNTFFKVKPMYDKFQLLNRKRALRGNCFSNKNDAEKIVSVFLNFRKKQFVKE